MALAALTLQACATGTAPDRAQVASGIAERSGFGSLTLPEKGSAWSAPPGATLDDGLTIDEAVGIALWNNADFQVALSGLGLARADLIEAGLIRNPIFSLLLPWGPKQLEFTATMAIDQIWQRPKRIADATLNAQAGGEQLIASGLRLVADVRLAFFEALVAERRLSLAADQAAIAAQAAQLVEGQLRAGDVSEFEARLARADAIRIETARLARVTGRDLSLVRLRALIGLDPQTPAFRMTEPNPAAFESCSAVEHPLQSAFAARPDLRAAELQVEAAGARAGLEKGRIVSLTASLDANARGTEGFEMGPGLGIEVPVFSQNQGRRARVAAELEQASRRYVAVRAVVSAEVATALVGLTEARNVAVLLSDDAAVSVTRAREQADRLYAAGEISLLTLLQTRQRLIDLEAARVDATFGVDRAVVRLEQAVGRTCGAR